MADINTFAQSWLGNNSGGQGNSQPSVNQFASKWLSTNTGQSSQPAKTPAPSNQVQSVPPKSGGFNIGDTIGNFFSGVGTAINNAIGITQPQPVQLPSGLKVSLTPPTVQPQTTNPQENFPTITNFNPNQTQLTPDQMIKIQAPNIPPPPQPPSGIEKLADGLIQATVGQLSDVYEFTRATGQSWADVFRALTGQKMIESTNLSPAAQRGQDIIGNWLSADFVPQGGVDTEFLANRAASKVLSNVSEIKSVPQSYFLNAQDLRSLGNSTTNDLLKSLNLTGQDLVTIRKAAASGNGGVAVEIPSSTILQIADKPYFAKIKSLLGIESKTASTVIESQAKPTVTQIAGLLGDGEHTPQQIVNTIIKNNLQDTADGKQLMQTVVEAQKAGQNINIETPKPIPTTTQQLTNVIQNIRAIQTPDDKILNPIIDQISAIIKQNEQTSSSAQAQNNEVQAQREASQAEVQGGSSQNPENTTNIQSTEAGQRSNGTSSIQSQSNATTQRTEGIGISSRGKPEAASTAEAIGSRNTGIQPNAGSSEPANRAIGNGGSLKVSKIAKEIEAKAVEQKLTTGFSKLAGYSPITIKEQAKQATDLVNNNFEDAKAIAKGEKPLPEGLKGTSLVTALEKHLEDNPDAQLALDLAKSPLVSGTSTAAQELRLAAERDPYAPISIIKQLEDNRKAIIGKSASKEVKSIQARIKKNTPLKEDWQSFIQSITCGN